jgi:protoporphyrin/coproporphyrin ferrochelatase
MSKGVLLVNLGSPDSPSVPDVRRYLGEFLMDPRVLDAPWLLRFCIVYFGILPSRPAQSAEAYHKIWTSEGSPLVVLSRKVLEALQSRISAPAELAMRYQNPSIPAGLKSLKDQGVNELLVIPLFPHYAMSSYETAVVRVKEVAASLKPPMRVTVPPPYYNAPAYIEALVGSAAEYLRKPFDCLLFSFHGIPERHIRKSDTTGRHCLQREDCCSVPSAAHATCYRAQCFKTVEAFAKAALLPKSKYTVSFQSRLGRDPWLRPYTDHELERLANSGVRKLLVMCPAFVSDCLETIEEIGMRGRESFMGAGGTEFQLIPCLNEHELWLRALRGMVESYLGDQAVCGTRAQVHKASQPDTN